MPKLSKIRFIYLAAFFIAAFCTLPAAALQISTQTQLAKVYEQDTTIPISDYLVSEKYDGIRAIWTGSQLLTRQGNVISAPEWFTAPLPDVWLDGELWTKRQNFEELSSIVRTQTPKDNRWRQVKYMVFDMPDARLPFEERYKNYSNLIAQINAEHIKFE